MKTNISKVSFDTLISVRKFDKLSYRTKRSARMHRAAYKVVFASQTRLAQVCEAHFFIVRKLFEEFKDAEIGVDVNLMVKC